MRLSRLLHKFGRQIEASVEQAAHTGSHGSSDTRSVLRNVGWVSAGITVLALGVVVGREVRQRYKFHRRTPYDLYAHAGDQAPDVEFGVGI